MIDFISSFYIATNGPVSYIASIATILGLLLIILQLHDSKIKEERARAFQLIDRFWLQINQVYLDLCEDNMPLSISRVAARKEYITLISYFDELGYLWVHDIIDKEITRSRLGNIVIVSFNLMNAYINEFRDSTNNPSYLIDWEKMTHELKNPKTKFNLTDFLNKDC